MTIPRRHATVIHHNFTIDFSEYSYENNREIKYIYGSIRIRSGGGKSTSFSINRKTFTKQYILACEKQAEWHGWPHAPQSWLKRRPTFDNLMKRCHVIEVPHPKNAGEKAFELI